MSLVTLTLATWTAPNPSPNTRGHSTRCSSAGRTKSEAVSHRKKTARKTISFRIFASFSFVSAMERRKEGRCNSVFYLNVIIKKTKMYLGKLIVLSKLDRPWPVPRPLAPRDVRPLLRRRVLLLPL